MLVLQSDNVLQVKGRFFQTTVGFAADFAEELAQGWAKAEDLISN
jgi:hypothetical protein